MEKLWIGTAVLLRAPAKWRRMRGMKVCSFALAFLLAPGAAVGAEHGKVIAVRQAAQEQYIPANGTSPAVTVNHPMQIYRVDAGATVYEFEEYGSKARFALGDTIAFRIDDDHKHAVVLLSPGGKAKRLRVIAEELKANNENEK